MSLAPLDPAELAAVVTYLEMVEPARAPVPPSPLRLVQHPRIAADDYRSLFRDVGARWLWFSRLLLADAALLAILHDEHVELSVVTDAHDSRVGLLELDFRKAGECELSFLGLVSALAGHGQGRWLLAAALERAWRPGVNRVHVHTCSLDHPAALPAYRRAGFVPFARAVERFADPRVAGVLPPDCAPQVPLLGTPAGTATWA